MENMTNLIITDAQSETLLARLEQLPLLIDNLKLQADERKIAIKLMQNMIKQLKLENKLINEELKRRSS